MMFTNTALNAVNRLKVRGLVIADMIQTEISMQTMDTITMYQAVSGTTTTRTTNKFNLGE